jgi:hypothetical protein
VSDIQPDLTRQRYLRSLRRACAGPENAAGAERQSSASRSTGVITDLVALGWLTEPDHANKRAIARAVADLVERAVLAHATPCANLQARTSFVLDLPSTTMDTLIGLRWLPVERAGDRDEIMAAFRRFAG